MPNELTPRARRLNRLAIASLLALVVLCVGWELWWAPLQPGGSRLALKALPLLLPLRGLLRGRRYTHQWASMLILAYLVEGLVRATSDAGPSRWLAAIETALSLAFFVAAIFYARVTSAGSAARSRQRAC
jgi:uncharacterized membrane protein